MPPKLRLSKKILFSIVLVVLLLAALEIGLRAARLALSSGVQIAGELDDCSSVVIMCIGDSMTYGLGAKPEESYPATLAPELSTAYGRIPFKTYNLGVAGINSTRALLQVKQFFERNPTALPDFALIMVGVNNRWNLQDAAFWRWADNPAGDSQMRRLVSQLQLNKAFSVLAEKARGAANGGQINGHEFRQNLDEHGWDVFFTSFEDPLLARWIETDLRDLARQLREREVTPVFLSYHFPHFPELNPLLEGVAERTGAMWLNIEQPGEYYMRRQMFDPDGFHLNAKGYRDLARRIALEFQRQHRADDLRTRLTAKQVLCAGPTL